MKLKNGRQAQRVLDESGFSLVEILGAIVILGIAMVMIAMLIIQNNLILSYNTRMEEAIAARDDVKEWLIYRAQTQDLADLNIGIFTARPSWMMVDPDDPSEVRRHHLVLDNSGIQYNAQGQPMYEEIPIAVDDLNRGRFIRKVVYDHSGAHLPQPLANSEENRLYMGTYLSENEETTNYLVKVSIREDPRHGLREDTYDRRQLGIGLIIQVFDKQTGVFLTETYLHWVVDY
ncbi:prepilin-type cleavage/methylation protein [Enterococcus casseliflavus 14-MB-W-14]|uniref:type IV pilus modification PilV family protein n=1 Tax=Enterococcus casseliflavus TaxID=37734 RepID=UPI000352E829|nr:prepilin-type N-terminal cleavage/methylation domain-containing protein [Enterococcus casseliflavus]EPH61809.1 prepilin-type cleavage/methylation protein [Enterococcus casseliflavus 14-MB-W-14]MEB6086296.1 prepilin-type cleavage/methylation protein [Enterococcus casseliflavus]MRI69837.1 prepilin-type cleavage/methylation protein [Enterococcus casseliflavus]